MYWIIGILVVVVIIIPTTLWIIRIVATIKFNKQNKDFKMDSKEKHEFQQEVNDMKLRYIENEKIKRTDIRYNYKNKR